MSWSWNDRQVRLDRLTSPPTIVSEVSCLESSDGAHFTVVFRKGRPARSDAELESVSCPTTGRVFVFTHTFEQKYSMSVPAPSLGNQRRVYRPAFRVCTRTPLRRLRRALFPHSPFPDRSSIACFGSWMQICCSKRWHS